MSPDDVIEHLTTRPFEPFRIFLSDGETYDVAHPDLVIVSFSRAIIGIPPSTTRRQPVERAVSVALSHITRIEPPETAARHDA